MATKLWLWSQTWPTNLPTKPSKNSISNRVQIYLQQPSSTSTTLHQITRSQSSTNKCLLHQLKPRSSTLREPTMVTHPKRSWHDFQRTSQSHHCPSILDSNQMVSIIQNVNDQIHDPRRTNIPWRRWKHTSKTNMEHHHCSFRRINPSPNFNILHD